LLAPPAFVPLWAAQSAKCRWSPKQQVCQWAFRPKWGNFDLFWSKICPVDHSLEGAWQFVAGGEWRFTADDGSRTSHLESRPQQWADWNCFGVAWRVYYPEAD